MRLLVAKVAVDLMESEEAEEAARKAIADLGTRVSGRGGIITIDREGRAGHAFNTEWMPWGFRTD